MTTLYLHKEQPVNKGSPSFSSFTTTACAASLVVVCFSIILSPPSDQAHLLASVHH